MVDDQNEGHHYVHNRMERIELKMDRLVEAVTLIARHDERLIGVEERLKAGEARMNSHATRLNALERAGTESGMYQRGAGWLVQQLLVIGAAAGAGWFYAQLPL